MSSQSVGSPIRSTNRDRAPGPRRRWAYVLFVIVVFGWGGVVGAGPTLAAGAARSIRGHAHVPLGSIALNRVAVSTRFNPARRHHVKLTASNGTAGDYDGTLYALDERTGTILWSESAGQEFFDPENVTIAGSMVFADHRPELSDREQHAVRLECDGLRRSPL